MTDKNTRKQPPEILRFLIKLFQILLYIPIQIVFIPFAVIGIIDGIYKGMGESKKLGISFTSCRALQYRWVMHYFNTRPDPLSVAFTKQFPCESHFGLWSTMGALVISQRLFGFTTKLGKVPEPGEFNDNDRALLSMAYELLDGMRGDINAQAIHAALNKLFAAVAEANRYVDAQAPWGLKKTDPPRMQTVLYVLSEIVRHVAILLQPVTPESANRMLDQVSVAAEDRSVAALGASNALAPGTELPKPEGVFPRHVALEESA